MSDFLTTYTSAESAGIAANMGETTIVCRFRAPSRLIAVNIADSFIVNCKTVDIKYRALIEGVLQTAAKSIVSRYTLNTLASASMLPTSIPSTLLTEDAILDEASGSNSEWLSKEDLDAAWKQSATRASIFNADKYKANQQYRKAFARFEELITKLAGKTSSYTPEELDTILAKLHDDDMTSEFGSFVLRRIEALKNKPQKATDVDMGLL